MNPLKDERRTHLPRAAYSPHAIPSRRHARRHGMSVNFDACREYDGLRWIRERHGSASLIESMPALRRALVEAEFTHPEEDLCNPTVTVQRISAQVPSITSFTP
jgi:hypothetical protein